VSADGRFGNGGPAPGGAGIGGPGIATPSAVRDGVDYWPIGTEFRGVKVWDGSWSQCHDNDVYGGCRFCGWYLSRWQLSPSPWQAPRLRARDRQPRRG